MAEHRVTGHVKIVKRGRGPVVYLKYRDLAGRQHQELLGDLYVGKGRPSAGFYTRNTAAASCDRRVSS